MATTFGQFLASASPGLSEYAVGYASAVSGGERRWLWSDVRSLMQANLGTLAYLSAAPAGTLSGNTLAAGVVSSSLTSVGTIGTGVWQGTAIADAYIASSATWNAKEPAIAAGTTAQYWRGDKSWQTLNSSAVGLGNVENTALSTWAGSTAITTLGTITTGIWHGTAVADSWIASAATWNAKEPGITSGTTSQYWRGDKTFQTLDKSAVGLNNVENTALSTWVGSTNLTTLGTIATGVWNGTAIGDAYIASTLTGKTYNGLTLTALAIGFSISGGTTSKTLTVPLAATVSGTNTGDQTNISGNAATATALQTGRNINGVYFDGTADITVTAAAGTLTGTTLNATVVTSSLTTVGTIATGEWRATVIADTWIASSATWNAKVGTVSGTANEITSSGTTAITLSLPNALTFTGKTVTGGTFNSGAFNGTLGATTPSTIASTTLSSTGSATLCSSSGTIGIGTAAVADVGVKIFQSVTSTGLEGGGMNITPTIGAAANSDVLYGFAVSLKTGKGAFTGISAVVVSLSQGASSGAGSISSYTGLAIGSINQGTTNYAITTTSGLIVFGDTTDATTTGNGSVQISGGLSVAKQIVALGMQNTPIGATTPSTGAFTTLSATGIVTLTDGRILMPATNTYLDLLGGTTGTAAGRLILAGSTHATLAGQAFLDGVSVTIRSNDHSTNYGVFSSTGLAVTGALQASTVKATSAAGYISSDGSTGYTGTVTTASLVGKTITIKDGIITGFA